MSYDARFIVVVFAAFAVANAAVSALVPTLWRRRLAAAAITHADDLRHLRLLPAIVALLSMTLAGLSFVFFEPREHERIGLVMTTLALLTSALFVASVVRAVALFRASRCVMRLWMATAAPVVLEGWTRPAFAITSDFPIVAVVGAFRPRLIVARSVLGACSAEELRAIVAHESGHAERRDNSNRMLFAATPDLISWLPVSKRVAAAWNDAAEDAADDCAASLGERGRVMLAQALIRVARLAPSRMTSPTVVPASALYRGESIERRVRRLLTPMPARVLVQRSPASRVLLRLAVVAACVLALHGVYEVLEAAVTFLP